MPFFSVVIPVYNRAGFIEATINSILQQDFDDFELIIVNDGSTDESENVIKEIADVNPAIAYIWQKNSERGAARNKGFHNASGYYVVFFDSDDLMHHDHLSVLHKKIIEQNYPNFIASKSFLRRNNKTHLNPSLYSLKEGYYDINFVLKGSHFACNFAVKKNNHAMHLFVEDRNFAILEDWIFIVQNLSHDKIYVVDKTTITMNDHDERSIRRSSNEIVEKYMLATQWIENNVNGLTPDQREMLWGYCYQFCAINNYTAAKRWEAIKYLHKAIRLLGINKDRTVLFIKILIGYKLIQLIKG